jgi:V8-like Glu-specific endopeptidase
MICHKLDREIQDLARKNQCTYSRYADDITFSFTGNKRNLPIDLIKFEEDGGIFIGQRLNDILSKNGFKLNGNKIRFQPYSQRQEVTGLIVNKSVNVKRAFIRKTQSMLHAWKKFGPFNAEIDYVNKYRKKKLLERHKLKIGNGEFFIKVVKGRVNFIRMVRGADDIIYKKLAYQLTEAFGKPNYDFLKTKEFIAVDSIFILENNSDISQGTAFLIENVGIVTNFHVVKSISDANETEVELYRYNESSVKRSVKFVKSSTEKDLAIFKPKSDFSSIKHLKIGDDSKLQQGSEVIVIGYPQHSPGAGPYIKASKVVQFRNYLGKNLWLIDSPIVHGNSGGPVFNSDMQVIGIATAGPETHTGDTIFNGFIPISELIQFASH